MALIKCPECGNQISDKSKTCIHCGYPLDNIESTELYNMVLINADTKANYFIAKSTLVELYGVDKTQAYNLLKNPGSVLIKGVKKSNIEYLKHEFNTYGFLVNFTPSEDNYIHPHNDTWNEWEKKRTAPTTCPRCGSTEITTGQRGFSFITGFIGSNKTVNRCAKCGYSWQPK